MKVGRRDGSSTVAKKVESVDYLGTKQQDRLEVEGASKQANKQARKREEEIRKERRRNTGGNPTPDKDGKVIWAAGSTVGRERGR